LVCDVKDFGDAERRMTEIDNELATLEGSLVDESEVRAKQTPVLDQEGSESGRLGKPRRM